MGAHEDRIAGDNAAWAAACRLGTFSYTGLAADVNIPLDRASELVRRWVRSGSVEALGKCGGNKLMFRVIRVHETAPLTPPAQTPDGNMWRTMRKFKAAFTPTDIAAHATTDTIAVSTAEAAAFCQMLVRAGYLRVARKAVPGRREAVYRLVRDTGPRPPRERRVRAIWDDNLAAFTHLPEGAQ